MTLLASPSDGGTPPKSLLRDTGTLTRKAEPSWLTGPRNSTDEGTGVGPPRIPQVYPLVEIGPRCRRCSSLLYGETYFCLERPGGGTTDLCRKCIRRVRVRLRMLMSRPDRGICRMLKSAMVDLKEAKRLDPTNKQIQDNIAAVKSSLSVASGSWLCYACVWLPLWVIVGPWKYGLIPILLVIIWLTAAR